VRRAFTLIELLVAITVVAVISGGAWLYLNNNNSRQKLEANRDEVVSSLKLAQSYAKTRQVPLGYTGPDLQYVQVTMNGNDLIAGVDGVGTTYFDNPLNNSEVTVTLNPPSIYFWSGGTLSHDNKGTIYKNGETATVIVQSKDNLSGRDQIIIDALGQVSP
jgi:prepilin-type N-terminal cleavage/methylation domain-containing protein